MLKNIIFDITRVILKFDRTDLLLRYFKVEDIPFVFDKIFDGWEEMDEDTITVNAYTEKVLARLPINLRDSAAKLLDNWEDSMTFSEGICEYLAELKKKGFNLYILSNMTRHFMQNDYKFNDAFKYFDGIVYSAPIKMLKPERRIYDYVVNKYSLNSQDCLFIDDLEENLVAPREMGMKTFLFKYNLSDLKNYVESLR